MKTILYKYPAIFALCWAIFIFILCATPGQYIPSANWLELLSIDKWVHAFVFFVLTLFLFLSAIKYRQKKIVLVLFFLVSVAYGILLELMQAYFFSNRSADWLDAIADGLGCVIALFFLKRISIFVSENKTLA